MKPKPHNEAGISWLGGGGQLRPEKLSGNTGLLSQLPRAALGPILVFQSQACLHPSRWRAHGVFIWV